MSKKLTIHVERDGDILLRDATTGLEVATVWRGAGIKAAEVLAAAYEARNACVALVDAVDSAPPTKILDYVVRAADKARVALKK